MRSEAEVTHELQMLDQAHSANETARDAFISLGHTALFASSISFVGDVTPLDTARWKFALLACWFCSLIGLLAMTASFVAARKLIDARREVIWQQAHPVRGLADWTNEVALYSFPLSLVCLFAFVTVNLMGSNDKQIKQSPAIHSQLRKTGSSAADASAGGSIKALDRGNPRSSSAVIPNASAGTSKEVKRAGPK